ncbi:MAG: cysteine desulfurase family protein [Bacteroidetes bacterium]|nr:cysteine desulfurase family protein [Bacteroidota bacterium]
MVQTIYLDYNSTTPLDSKVLEAMLPYFTEEFGNAASSTHRYGWVAKDAVECARKQIADLIGAEPGEIIFTSGATESINLSIQGIYNLFKREKNHLITVRTEHKAVLDVHAFLQKEGAEVTYLGVDAAGQIDLLELENAITDKTALVSVMLANNETGVIQDIHKISQIVHSKRSILFSDATQAIGKMKVNVNDLGIDAMPLSAHKIYGPKGVGALYLRRKAPRVRLQNPLHTGTANVPGIVGLGKACEILEIEKEGQRLSTLKTELFRGLSDLGFLSNVPLENTLNNTLNFRHPVLKASDLLVKTRDLAYSLGSACNSADPSPSYVLLAMGMHEKEIKNSFRISLGRHTAKQDLASVLKIFHTTI